MLSCYEHFAVVFFYNYSDLEQQQKTKKNAQLQPEIITMVSQHI